MSEFRKSIEDFRDAMHRKGELAAPPSFSALLSRNQSPCWAIAATVLLTLGGGLTYRAMQRERAIEQEKADVLLLKEIDAEISRPVARALSSLMGN